ncbi:MAG: LuxR C-terminal-related transcriptional regulator, partial [Oscillospiraceae bacterium]|nr:LuxR C-terminal-related transcriptional regulator [Oscillospiraceae bacterium]
LTRSVAFDNPVLATKLRELGFPDTPARFSQFADILRTSEHRSNKTFLVLDDFHLIHTEQALLFAERCAHLRVPGACVIIISRNEPEINAVSLFSKGQASRIIENDLCFTDDEIVDFLRYFGVPFSLLDLPQFSDTTKGWALAIKLLSLVLKRAPGNIDIALKTMKQNVFKLMESEAWADFSESTQRKLVRLSLISDLPLTPLREALDDASLMRNASQLSLFIWFDSFIGDYRIHPLYLEFLQSRQSILSEEEKQDMYRKVAAWCDSNNFYTDAVNYYAKSRQYDRILNILLTHPFKLPPDNCKYFLSILEGIDPENKDKSDYNVLVLKNLFVPRLYIGIGKYEKARELSFENIREWEHSSEPISSYLLYTAYSNLAYIDMYICTITHEYNFKKYMEKALRYYKMSAIQPIEVTGSFSVVDIRSYACLVGEGADLPEFGRFLEIARDTNLLIEETYHSMFYGYDDLAECEFAFFRNQINQARSCAYNAILKAREKKQYSIEAIAQFYLLRTAVHEGDYQLVNEVLRQLHDHLDNQHFWNSQMLYDLITGSFYAFVGLTDMVPSWIAAYEKEPVSEVRIPVRELIVSVGYFISLKKYKQALAILCNSYPRAPHERFYFGELAITLLLAVTRYRTDDVSGALNEFEKAYEMSLRGEFEMTFIELGTTFHDLTVAALKQKNCSIPEQWLKTIDRKAAIYAKRVSFIRNSIKRARRIEDVVTLTDRERDVLSDLYYGLSRDEIASNRYLSINTVKKILQSIYMKLDANNNVDAIRIAIEKKLID